MIEGLFTLLAIPAMFIAPITGWMTFSFFRDGETASGWKSAAVFAATSGILFVAYQGAPGPTYTSGDCRTDWDGRSNSTVCE